MKFGLIITSIIVGSVLSGCSDSLPVPACNDTKATDLVIETANAIIVEANGEENASKIKLGVEAIKTTASNKETGANTCAADMSVLGENGQTSFPITYTVEAADNGDKFKVNVIGL